MSDSKRVAKLSAADKAERKSNKDARARSISERIREAEEAALDESQWEFLYARSESQQHHNFR